MTVSPDYSYFPSTEAIGVLFTIALALIQLLVWLFHIDLKSEVKDPASRPYLIAKYQLSGAQGYYRAIRRIIYAANRLYGPRLLSPRAFGRCLQLALVYPVIALMIGWLLFDAGTLGGVVFLPEGYPWYDRLWRFGVVILVFSIAAGSLKFAGIISDWIEGLLTGRRDTPTHRAGFLSKAAPWVGEIAYFVAFAVAVAGAVAVAVTGVVAVAFAGALALAFAFAGAVAVAVAVAVAGNTDSEAATVLLLFFVLLPWLNALADFLSVAATRYFLNHIRRQRPGFWRVAFDVLIDLAVALACLVGLIVALWLTLLAWESLAPTTLAFDWRGYAGDILEGTGKKAPRYGCWSSPP